MATHRFLEATTGEITGTLVDLAGVGVPVSQLTTLTLTLRNAATGAIVNGRNQQNVKNANNVTVGDTGPTAGQLVWAVQAADTPIIDAGAEQDLHDALFEWTWPGGAGKALEHLLIPNLVGVP